MSPHRALASKEPPAASSLALAEPRSLVSWLMSGCIHLAVVCGLLWGAHRWGNYFATQDGYGTVDAKVQSEDVTGENFVDSAAPLNEHYDAALDGQQAGERSGSELTTAPLDPIREPEQGAPTDLLARLRSVRSLGNEASQGVGPSLGRSAVSGSGSPVSTSKGYPRFEPQGSTAKVFGIEGKGRKFVFIFDRSGSMDDFDGAPLFAAKQELQKSIAGLSAGTKFQIIFYNDKQQYFQAPSNYTGRLAVANAENKQAAKYFINSIVAGGGTEHYDALVLGLRMAPDVIYFLTDADEPQLTETQLERISERNQGAVINTIEFGTHASPADEGHFLVRLAHTTGGAYTYVNVLTLQRPATSPR